MFIPTEHATNYARQVAASFERLSAASKHPTYKERLIVDAIAIRQCADFTDYVRGASRTVGDAIANMHASQN